MRVCRDTTGVYVCEDPAGAKTLTEQIEATVRQIGKVTVIDLTGKISIGEGEVVLRERVVELLEARQNYILLNLENVPFMDSAGIGQLVACFGQTKAAHGALKLLNPTESVKNHLRQTKLYDQFEIYYDEDTALAAF
jgi:anti-sigma B factor antagonist